MVALQILVLTVGVRILLGELSFIKNLLIISEANPGSGNYSF